MGSEQYTSRGAKLADSASILPEKLVTICDPRHPQHAGRNASEYKPGNQLFDRLVQDFMGPVGFVDLPRAEWIQPKGGEGYWQLVNGSKRVEAAKYANAQIVDAGGEPRKIQFVADLKAKPELSAIKHVAANHTRTQESAYTVARHAATLLGREWGGHRSGTEADMGAVLARIRYRERRISEEAMEMALHPDRGFPHACQALIDAVHGGLSWTAAMLICPKPHEAQEQIIAALGAGQASFVAAGGHEDEYWQEIGVRDVKDAFKGRFTTPIYGHETPEPEPVKDVQLELGSDPAPGPVPELPTVAAPAPEGAKPVRLNKPSRKQIMPSGVAKTLLSAAKEAYDKNDVAGPRLRELRAIYAFGLALAGEDVPEDVLRELKCLEDLYAIARQVQH